MEHTSETILSHFNKDFGKMDFPMILTEYEKAEVKVREVTKAIDRAKYQNRLICVKEAHYEVFTAEDIDNIILRFKIDLEAAYDFANRMKHSEINQTEWRRQTDEMEANRIKSIHDHWTAEQMYRHMTAKAQQLLNGEKLIFDQDNGHAIEALCYFMAGDDRFESKLGYSLKKGIMLMGSYGTGKSFLIKLLKDNELNPIVSHSLIRVEHEVRNQGRYVIDLSENYITYLDDVGTEKEIQKHYGNHVNWFQEWIELMYEDNKPFNRLILSTNLDPNELEGRYTGRVRSRLTEKMNIIPLTGKDRRREK